MRKAGPKLFPIVVAACAIGACGEDGVSEANAAAARATCPTQAETEATLTNYITKDYWKPSEREIWRVTAVDGFTFTPIRVGAMIKKQVEFGQTAQDVCPLRITYSFNVTKADGRREKTEMGADKTHLFYKDAFGDWTFKAETR